MSGAIKNLKASISSGKYEFRLVRMKEGVNSHHTFRNENLEFKHKI